MKDDKKANNMTEDKKAFWIFKFGKWEEELNLSGLKEAAKESFENESDSYKQKLVYDLLEATKNKDQNRFFYLLLKAINKPKEAKFKELWEKLNQNYDILPQEAFVNFAYSIIIGIMSTYNKGQQENK